MKNKNKGPSAKKGIEKSCRTCDHDQGCGGNDSGIFPCPDYIDKPPEDEELRHLCATCVLEFATCNSNPVFGTGLGNDNVKECDSYIKTDSQVIATRQEDPRAKALQLEEDRREEEYHEKRFLERIAAEK